MKAAFTVPELPSVTDTGLTVKDGAVSSLLIVPVPVPVAIVQPTGFDSVTVNVSFASNFVSPFTVTLNVPDGVFAGIVSVPLADA